MRYSFLLPTLFLAWVLSACQAPEKPAEQSAGAEIFGSGTISTGAPEFAVTFTPDGGTVYFNRTAPDRSSLVIMRSRLVDGVWQAPDTASFSGTWFDVDPFVTPDGNRLYFSSNRPVSPEDTLRNFNSWVVLLSDRGEDEPAFLPEPINSDSSDTFVSTDSSGMLYFSSRRDGERRIYRASTSGTDAEVGVVPFDMNVNGSASNPAISPDGRHMVFSAIRETGLGGADLYVTSLSGDTWSPSRLLPESINSAFTDFAPSWSADGAYLYFTSERPGIAGPVAEGVRPPGDIYRVSVDEVLESDAAIR